jgi:predicted permease
MRRFGGDPKVLGRALTLNGQRYEVIGVLPVWFSIPRDVMPTLGNAEQSDILLPLPLAAEAPRIRNREDYNLIARLRPGVTLAEAQQEMDGLTAALRAEHPDVYPPSGGLTFSVVPLQRQVVGGVQRALAVLLGAVGFVLLIACANVANLLLARALARQREMAVRAALGAGAARLVRQVLTETVVLGLAGGLAGLLLGVWTLSAIRALGAGSVPRVSEIGIDGRVLAFTAAISILSGLIFGLLPALRSSRIDVNAALKDAARGASGAGAVWGRGHHARRLLVVAEIALSVILLVGAGLLIRSFARIQQVHPGFNQDNVLTLELTLTGPKYADSQSALATYTRLWDRLRQLPGVTAAGGVSAIPLSGMMAWGPITVEGRTPAPGEAFVNVDIRTVAGSYFEAMQIPLRRGRLFTEQDTRTSQRVIVIDEEMARRLWPTDDAIGKRVRTGGMDASPDAPWMTVVGIVGRVKQDALDAEPRMAMHLAHTQATTRAMTVVLRTSTNPDLVASAARAAVREIDPDLPVYHVMSMAHRVDDTLARRRFAMLLFGAFAALAAGLAAVGVYSVIAYLVSQSTRELGIRLALGATPGRLRWFVIRQGLAIAGVGVGIGLAGAFALGGLMRGLLFEVPASDPATFAMIAILLGAIAIAATYLPGRRAARIDLTESLRSE